MHVVFPYLHTSYLAGDGFRELVDKLYAARVFVRGRLMLHMLLQLLDQCVAGFVLVVLRQDNGGFDYHAAYRVGDTVTAHSTTAGWVISALSTSNGPMR